MHYILDLWTNRWRRRRAHGRVVIVRYADDFVMGFESKANAQEMLLALRVRLASFGLTLHEDKTRLIEFGRFAALSRQRRGERRPETRDLRLPRLHPLLRPDPRWPVHREAQDVRETPDA
nr:reverse transcriptase domain-containing protein [Bradyrhizobium sp. 144]